MAWLGLALGLWIQDPVRGLIAALATWCALLFGTDLLLILIGGSEWIQANPASWVAALMASPLDAYRITLLLVVERAAFSSADLTPLTRWWIEHPSAWLVICLTCWWVIAVGLAVAGARHRRTC
jgi:ABC-2 type transport system permease protein/Cu-processing system permease protein